MNKKAYSDFTEFFIVHMDDEHGELPEDAYEELMYLAEVLDSAQARVSAGAFDRLEKAFLYTIETHYGKGAGVTYTSSLCAHIENELACAKEAR